MDLALTRRGLILGLGAAALVGCNGGADASDPQVSVPQVGTRPLGSELLVNNTFTGWAKGTPRALKFKTMGETADHWFTKWGNTKSTCTVSKAAGGGMRYDMKGVGALQPNGTVDCFYARQTPGSVKWFFGKTFETRVDVEALSPGLRGCFYINLRWNKDQRVNGPNTGPHWPLSGRQTIVFQWTAESHPEIKWKVASKDNGLEFAFLTYVPDQNAASVIIHSVSVKQIG